MLKNSKQPTRLDLGPSVTRRKEISTENKNIRACIYARTARTGQDSNQAQQIKNCSQYIAQKGWTLSGLFLDEGVSGRDIEKPELSLMMEMAAKGSFDVVVSNMDCVYRSIKQLYELRKILLGFHVKLLSTDEKENTAFGSKDFSSVKRS